MMQGDASSKKANAYGFMDLIFSWSMEDIMNEELYKNKVEKIELSFQSIQHYLGSYKYPLLEETRASLCSSMEIIHQAPYAELRGLKEAKPYKNNLYNLKIDSWKNKLSHDGELYKTLPGDVLILSDYKPEELKDLQRVGRQWSFVSTVGTTEDYEGDIMSFYLKVKASKEIDLEELRNKNLYLIFLTNVIPYRRIWNALSMPGGNFKLLKQILTNVEDIKCSNCGSLANALRDDCPYQNLLSELNESQVKAISACLSGINCDHNSVVKLIWGPPGTGKTRTLGTLLFALMKIKYRVLVCASTNVAIKEVVSRVVNIMKESHSKESGDLFCSLGEVLLFGNHERLKVGEDVEDVYLDHRVEKLSKCFSPSTGGFISCLRSMIHLLEHCVSEYHKELEKEERRPQSFLLYLRDKFHEAMLTLQSCISILCTHVPTSHLSKQNNKKLVFLNEALESFEDLLFQNNVLFEGLEYLFARKNLPWEASVSFNGDACRLLKKRAVCLNALMGVEDSLDEILLVKSSNINTIKEFCFETSSLIFSTASGSVKLHHLNMKKPLNIVVIDEAAQLKDCESMIPLLLPGISHAILVGDERQLPAMVRSNVSNDAGFGRSLFQRLSSLGYPKYILNMQHRMHPKISSFPNSYFYHNQVQNAPNVERNDYGKQYLPGPMFGPYSFINVRGGKEQFDDAGISYRNMAEVAVVMTILKKLHKAWLTSKNKLSVGIVSPYAGQVAAIQNKLRNIHETFDGFSVDVKSVDGFQGGEKDVIILSTVRTHNRTSLQFISSPQRTNVALTRARHCLWIVGNERALTNNENVWKAIVLDAMNRKCFFHADQEEEMVKAILDAKKDSDEFDDLLDTNSEIFKNALWKVHFSDKFLRSFKRLRSRDSKNKVVDLLKRLSSGWRPKSSSENSSKTILKQFKVLNHSVIWSVEIIKTSRYIQALKIWDILPSEYVPQLVKRLDNVFNRFTDEYITRCKEIGNYNVGNIFPLSWPLSANIQKHQNDGDTNANEDTSEAENRRVEDEECLLLLKYCSISRDYIYGQERSQLGIPCEVTDEQRNIILFTRSSFILGRSGTGKTTVLMTKMIQNEKLHHMTVGEIYGSKTNAYLVESEEIVSDTERPLLRQLFVTLSPVLCQKVQHHVSILKRSLGEGSTVADSNDKNIPDSFDGLSCDLYPLVITFRKFLLMLDGTLGNSYFERFCKKNWGKEMETLMQKEVNYERFESLYWPHFNAQLCKKLDSYQVFTEIMSHIKGGTRTLEHGKLSRDEYSTLSENRASSLSLETRFMIYDIFQDYEKMKMYSGEFDLADIVIDLHSRLRNQRYKGDVMHFVYIDEVQDLTMAQIALFKHICRNVEEGFVFCGDTAQTVGRGIDFRFQDVRSIFYEKFLLESKGQNNDKRKEKLHISDIFVLGQNFYTNSEILKLSQSVIELLYYFFPHSIDLLKVETSLITGKAPVVIRSQGDANSILSTFGQSICKDENVGRFGTDQEVVLVRDNLAKEEVLRDSETQARVLTIIECKGLEFQDVLLYNFFTSSPLQRRWGVIYDYMKEHHMLDSRSHKKISYEDSKHNVLCSELKQLYVAITRARNRLWIYEDSEDLSKPMFDYWKVKNLVQFNNLNSSQGIQMKIEYKASSAFRTMIF
ncbi:hypothetical protein VNO78_12282 [Psophocarpus tetragonolobus]|uniref:UvrD-like helicase ATP-binding domain-containing protein n=1 Tax=Psophocarpus tetragonolobus TaxID=3891 RepID=A0AAN9XNU7_PSOTE